MDIDIEMVKAYFEELEAGSSENKAHKVEIQNTIPSSILKKGKSTRM